MQASVQEFSNMFPNDDVALHILRQPCVPGGEWRIFYETQDDNENLLNGARAVKNYFGTCEFFTIYVKASVRRTGVATRLFYEAMQEAVQRECDIILAIMANRTPERMQLFERYRQIVQDEFGMEFQSEY